MRAAWVLVVVLAACHEAPPTPVASAPSADTLALPPAFAARLDAAGVQAQPLDRAGDAYALARVETDSGGFLVQWADLGAVAVEQRLGTAAPTPPGPGLYHPTAPSPFVRFLDPNEVVRQVEAAHGDGALAVMNGAFFETPGAAETQLAFPLALRGQVVTGGSSPYGPGRSGAEGRRWSRPLRALGLDTLAHVADYDRATGAPLGQPGFESAVVSYAPDAHPTRISTRFHVLGALDADGDGQTETLVVVTSDGRTTIEAPAALLAALGVGSEAQVAVDGGASVFVWSRRASVLHRTAGGQPLPHLLTVRRR